MAQTGIMEELAKQNPYRDYDPTVLSGPTIIDPVLIMRIPTMISGIVLFFIMLGQTPAVKREGPQQQHMRSGTRDYFPKNPGATRQKCEAFDHVSIWQLHWYANISLRQFFLAAVGFLLVAINTVFIFFASIHCPTVMRKCTGLLDVMVPARNCELVLNEDCKNKWASWTPAKSF